MMDWYFEMFYADREFTAAQKFKILVLLGGFSVAAFSVLFVVCTIGFLY